MRKLFQIWQEYVVKIALIGAWMMIFKVFFHLGDNSWWWFPITILGFIPIDSLKIQ